MTDRTSYWENVYATRRTHEVSWYQIRPDTSLRLIATLGMQPSDAVIDVGGGASNLVDHLLDQSFTDVTVLDISASALSAVKERLGTRAGAVHWLAGDVTRLKPKKLFRLWHDRAVFHFLTDAEDRRAYLSTLSGTLPSGSHAIIATFAEDGPERCSNLPVCRYSPERLAAELGSGFTLVESLRETHVTPAQGEQKFIYCCFRRD
ncbi:MAG TPA: class I SAM-dependent methyltransferase [Rhodocyclaceae bacterium]|nr:class I SAM-dependent methyltransferase [Rhodocyclaceae bacterium]